MLKRYWWIAATVFVLDQASKWWADAYLTIHPKIELLPILNISLAYNRGVAFGLFNEAGGWQRVFFSVLALVVSFIIVNMVRRMQEQEKVMAIALLLVLGGAIGNLVDRVFLGYVIDFIDVYYQHWHWPTFNVADSAITVGAVLLVWDTLFGQGKASSKG